MPTRLDPSAALLAGASILYPLIAVATLHLWGPGAAMGIILAVLAARLLLPALRGIPASLPFALVPVLLAMMIVGWFNPQLSIRLYPVFMNVSMLAAFAATLWNPPSMAERFARVFEPDLPESGVRYTRNVTRVWIAFFAVNGSIALWTVFQPGWHAWLLYNGFLSYMAAGLLFAVEYVVRQRVRRSR